MSSKKQLGNIVANFAGIIETNVTAGIVEGIIKGIIESIFTDVIAKTCVVIIIGLFLIMIYDLCIFLRLKLISIY